MAEITHQRVLRVAADIAKLVIHVNAMDVAGHKVMARGLKRDQFLVWCRHLPRQRVVGMAACGGVHHWGWQLLATARQVRLIAANFVTPCRTEGNRGQVIFSTRPSTDVS